MSERTTYINQHEIDAVAEELRAIDPELRIESLSTRNGRADAVYVYVMEKGNKPLIAKLRAAGFTITSRKKIDADRIFGGTQYEGYSFSVTLKKYLGAGV